jgi:hypothetical protein
VPWIRARRRSGPRLSSNRGDQLLVGHGGVEQQNFIWPLLGVLFIPFTTLMYVIVYPRGIKGPDWLWLGLVLAIDIGHPR